MRFSKYVLVTSITLVPCSAHLTLRDIDTVGTKVMATSLKSDEVIQQYEELVRHPSSVGRIRDANTLLLLRTLCQLLLERDADIECHPVIDREALKRKIDSKFGILPEAPKSPPNRFRNSIPPGPASRHPRSHPYSPLGVYVQRELDSAINARLRDTEDASHKDHLQPNLAHWSDLTQEVIPKAVRDASYSGHATETVHLVSPPIYRAGRTGVFSIAELPDKVIKYYVYCKSTEDVFDAIVLESFFMEKLAKEQICPHVYYYSDYLKRAGSDKPFLPPQAGKTQSTKCDWDAPNPNIRYMIMEKVGESINEWAISTVHVRPDFINVMRAGAQMIGLLEKLHGWNILHGDAHWGNFAFRSGHSGDLVMIDFGRARIINESLDFVGGRAPRDNDGFCDDRDWLHVLTGKWEMKSCKPAFRDDVYRAVQNCAMAVYGDDLYQYLQNIAHKDSPHLGRYKYLKNEAKFFEIPPDVHGENEFSIAPKVPSSLLPQIREQLSIISREASMDYEDPLTKPAYTKIIRAYKKIIVLLDPSLARKSNSEIFRIV